MDHARLHDQRDEIRGDDRTSELSSRSNGYRAPKAGVFGAFFVSGARGGECDETVQQPNRAIKDLQVLKDPDSKYSPVRLAAPAASQGIACVCSASSIGKRRRDVSCSMCRARLCNAEEQVRILPEHPNPRVTLTTPGALRQPHRPGWAEVGSPSMPATRREFPRPARAALGRNFASTTGTA